MRGPLLVCLVLAGVAACGDASVNPLPLRVTIEASRLTAPVGQPVTFVVSAQGGSLVGVVVEYGDSSSDQAGAGGARTARFTFSHAFSAAGVYQVRATVTDATAGDSRAGVEIHVP